jgi:hypothetical protein
MMPIIAAIMSWRYDWCSTSSTVESRQATDVIASLRKQLFIKTELASVSVFDKKWDLTPDVTVASKNRLSPSLA